MHNQQKIAILSVSPFTLPVKFPKDIIGKVEIV